jgi:hypothetical protein
MNEQGPEVNSQQKQNKTSKQTENPVTSYRSSQQDYISLYIFLWKLQDGEANHPFTTKGVKKKKKNKQKAKNQNKQKCTN